MISRFDQNHVQGWIFGKCATFRLGYWKRSYLGEYSIFWEKIGLSWKLWSLSNQLCHWLLPPGNRGEFDFWVQIPTELQVRLTTWLGEGLNEKSSNERNRWSKTLEMSPYSRYVHVACNALGFCNTKSELWHWHMLVFVGWFVEEECIQNKWLTSHRTCHICIGL